MKPSRTRAFAIYAGLVSLLAGYPARAGEYEIAHPLCDGSIPCHRMVVWSKGTGVIDRVESKVDGDCKVTLNTGLQVTASTDTLSLSDGTVTTDGISRAWRFPANCPVWIHLRQPRTWPTKDVVWTETTTADIDRVFTIDWSRLPRP